MDTQRSARPAAVPDRSIEHQLSVLMQGVSFGDPALGHSMHEELAERLRDAQRSGRPLRVYLGVDPTSSELHLGHTVPLRKLRQFQDLGHDVIFLIGSFTGLIGDPSDKGKARQQQTPDQVRGHAETYVAQVYKILDPERTTIEYNDRWLAPLAFTDLTGLASHFTVQQFLTRDNFAARYANGEPIWLHEFFYALMQAYDAVALRTDVQVGGTEQLFNLMAGRKLMEAQGLRPQVCLTLPILVGIDGAMRMSKSTGNTIGINEAPTEQFGKVMSLRDSVMRSYFELVTRWAPQRIGALFAELEAGRVHPRDVKLQLAGEIVEIFHGRDAARAAQAYFGRVHQQRKLPTDINSFEMAGPQSLVEIMVSAGLASSNGAARRLVAQRGVRLGGQTVKSASVLVEPQGQVLQVGKRRFVRLVRSSK